VGAFKPNWPIWWERTQELALSCFLGLGLFVLMAISVWVPVWFSNNWEWFLKVLHVLR